MLELFTQMNSLDLLNNQQSKVDKTKFKDNIIFTSFDKKLLAMNKEEILNLNYDKLSSMIVIKNITKKEITEYDEGVEINKVVNTSFDEIFDTISQFDYFNTLTSFLEKIKKDNPLDYPSKIFNILSSDSLLRFQILKDDKNYMIDVLSNNANCIGAASGQKSWLFGISYGAVKAREDEIKFLSDKLVYANNYLKKNIIEEFNKYNSDTLNIDSIVKKLDELNENEYFNDIIEEKLSHLIYDSKSTQVYLTDYFGLNNYDGFNIEKIQENLLEYYLSNPKTNPVSKKIKGVCRSCSKEAELIKNNNYSKIFDYSSHTFNLRHITDGGKSVNNSVLFCQECSDKLDDINNMISSEKLHFIKIGVNSFSGGIKKYNNMSEIHTSGYDSIVESVFYQLHTDELSKAHNLIPIIEINAKEQSEKSQMAINFNLIQNLYGFKLMEKDSKWSSNWLDIIYEPKKKKEKKSKKDEENKPKKEIKDISIEKSIVLKDFWINNNKLLYNDMNKILIEFINNKLNEKDGIYYYYNVFSFLTDLTKYKGDEIFEDKYIFNNGQKSIEYGVKKSVYDLFTLKEGEETMFERHKRINNELSKLDDSDNELSDIELDLSDDDFWVLYGRIIGYLNQKSKSQEHSLDYMNKMKQLNRRNLQLILENSFIKYSYSISNNQTKFKLIYSYILENIDSKPISDRTFNSILSGSLNGKVIKLIKNIKKD